jgi:hypothetical protein
MNVFMVEMKQVFESLPLAGHVLGPQMFKRLFLPQGFWAQKLPCPTSLWLQETSLVLKVFSCPVRSSSQGPLQAASFLLHPQGLL